MKGGAITRHRTRMGDGRVVEMSTDEIRADIEAGTEDAADKGQIEPLTSDEQDYILELMTAPYRVVAVQPGNEVVLTDDGSAGALYGPQSSSGTGTPVSREQAIRVYERGFCLDTMEVGHPDYSFRPVKPIVPMEQQTIESVLQSTIIPIYYGAMPNLALYYDPDGPFGNPADFLPKAMIKEAREAQVQAAEVCRRDMIYISKKMAEVGADGINFDTTASAGDAEFLATLQTVEELANTTDLSIEVGMASEFVLGMHGELEYQGKRLAGMYPHDQVKMVEAAGAHVFGPAVNTSTRRSSAWNIARAVALTKACSQVATIPVHANVGMGVGGVPMSETPPIDMVTRASVAMVEIARLDGL